ncbi:MAG: hypothetical protein HOV68_05295 [Streptomycetaceae bacterium]|nr:hypothetical protein [Streptomycetaceae bacterium]
MFSSARRVLAHPIALILAAALLTVVGVLLWPERSAPRTPVGAPEPAPASTAAAQPLLVPASEEQRITSPPSPPAEDDPLAGLAPLPLPVTAVATAFTQAWASHDARPGKDVAYADAAARAAQFADGKLAAWLRTPNERPPLAWTDWIRTQANVTAQVTSVHQPDGAPTPTAQLAQARVFYRVTVSPATGPSTWSDAQVALELRTDSAGAWKVTALPYA